MPHVPHVPGHRHRQCGLTLVELMVSMLLGFILLGGVLTLYVSSHETFRTQEGLARIQENGRFALELMAREIREAGLTPCGSPLTANVVAGAGGATAPWWADTAAGFLRGGEEDAQTVVATGGAIADHVARTDSLLLLRPASDEGLITPVRLHDAAAQIVQVDAPPRMAPRDIVLMCDSGSSALWQVATVGAQTGALGYTASPLNCSTSLGRVGPGCASPVDKTFAPGALLVPWDPGLWYVGAQANGQRALYRARVIQPAAGAAGAALVTQRVERVPGVQNLQIEYLTRDLNNGGQLATGWVDARAFNGQWVDPAREVVAVRLILTLQAEAGTGRLLQREFRSVIALRNPRS